MSEKVLCVSAMFPHLEASEKCVLLSMALCECFLPGHEGVHSMAVRWGKHSWWPTQSFYWGGLGWGWKMCISLCVFVHWLGLSGNHFSKESQILSPELGQTESEQKGAWNTLVMPVPPTVCPETWPMLTTSQGRCSRVSPP